MLLPTDVDIEKIKNIEISIRNTNAKSLPYPYGDLQQKDTFVLNVDYKHIKEILNTSFYNNNVEKTRISIGYL